MVLACFGVAAGPHGVAIDDDPPEGDGGAGACPADGGQQAPVGLLASDIPWDELFPKPWNDHKTAIIEIALPYLLSIMQCEEHIALSPRQKVERAMVEVGRNQRQFWGRYDVFTRRRTVIDSVLGSYYQTLWSYVAGRSCNPQHGVI